MSKLQELQTLVAGVSAGGRLLAVLQGGEIIDRAQVAAAVVDVIKEIKGGGAPAPVGPPARLSLGGASAVINQLAFILPRGKQDLAFFPDRMVIKTAKADVPVPYAAIQHIAILDQIPKDTKGRVLLVLHLSPGSGVMNGKTALHAVVIQVLADQSLSVAHPSGEPGARLEGLAAVVLCQIFGIMGVAPPTFCSPDPAHFSSADGCAGVEAFVKARQGFLFPLPAGLCFLESPALFIPRASISSVELARAGGASSTFDLYIHCGGGATHEFSNLSRREVAAVEGYARAAGLRVGPAEGSDEVGDGGEDGGGGEGSGSDSDDPEDQDFDPEADSDGGGAATRRRKRGRRAGAGSPGADGSPAAAAGEGGGEEEEEEDDASEGSSDEEEGSSSDDDSDGGSVEMVSEEDFSVGQLRSMMEQEKSTAAAEGGAARKRAKQQDGGQD